jgi:2,3-dimethylmalate lyase
VSVPSTAARFRTLLAGPEIVQAPGAYDALSARIIEDAGFPAVYMTGFGTSAGLLGRPDVGLLSGTEMVENARRIVQAVTVPVFADADTGYGNPLNVIRTVELYGAAGLAGLHIEDQVAPKKCGHMEGKQVIPVEEMAQKLRAAVHARRDKDFVIIARTDARAVEGLDAAIERGRRYREAGADVLFIEAPQSEAECAAIATIRALGYRLVIYPISALLAATRAMQQVARTIKEAGTPQPYAQQMPTFAEFNSFIGLPAVQALEQEFRVRGPE